MGLSWHFWLRDLTILKELRSKKSADAAPEALQSLEKLKAWAEKKRLEAQKKAEEEAEYEDVPFEVEEEKKSAEEELRSKKLSPRTPDDRTSYTQTVYDADGNVRRSKKNDN